MRHHIARKNKRTSRKSAHAAARRAAILLAAAPLLVTRAALAGLDFEHNSDIFMPLPANSTLNVNGSFTVGTAPPAPPSVNFAYLTIGGPNANILSTTGLVLGRNDGSDWGIMFFSGGDYTDVNAGVSVLDGTLTITNGSLDGNGPASGGLTVGGVNNGYGVGGSVVLNNAVATLPQNISLNGSGSLSATNSIISAGGDISIGSAAMGQPLAVIDHSTISSLTGNLFVGNAAGSTAAFTLTNGGALSIPQSVTLGGNGGIGTLQLDTASSANNTGNLTVAAGSSLNVLSGSTFTAQNLVYDPAGTHNYAGGTVVLNGGIISNAPVVISNNGILYVKGASAYSGSTTVNSGGVVFGGASSIGGTGRSVYVGGNGAVGSTQGILDPNLLARIDLTSIGALGLTANDANTPLDFTSPTLAPFAGMSVGSIGNVTYTGTLTPAGNLYRLGGGPGTLTFNTPITGSSSVQFGNSPATTGAVIPLGSNSYSGTTTISGITLLAGALANGGSPSDLGGSTNAAANLVLDGGTLSYTGATSGSTDRLLSFTANGGTIIAPAGALNFTNIGATIATGTGNRQLNFVADNSATNTFKPSITDPISGTTSLAMNGNGVRQLVNGLYQMPNGILQLGSNNSYTGPTYLNGGTLQVTSLANGGIASSLGMSSNLPTNLVFNGGMLQYVGSGSASTDRLFTNTYNYLPVNILADGGALSFTNTGTISSYPPTNVSNFTLGGNSSATNSFSPSLDDGISLFKTGKTTWRLSNTNSFHFGITVQDGTLETAVNNALPYNADNSRQDYGLNLASPTARLNLAGHTEETNSLGGNGIVTNTSNVAATLTLGATNNPGYVYSTFSGLIQGKINLTLAAYYTATFTGTVNYTGTTDINNRATLTTNRLGVGDTFIESGGGLAFTTVNPVPAGATIWAIPNSSLNVFNGGNLVLDHFKAWTTPLPPGFYTPKDFDGTTLNTTLYLKGTITIPSSWNASGSGSWTAASNWGGSAMPGGMGTGAEFGPIGSDPDISLDGNQTVGSLSFNSTNTYNIVPGSVASSTLTLDTGPATSQIQVWNGNHNINVPVQMNSNVLVSVMNATSSLTVNGSISGAGGLTEAGTGTLFLANSSSYAGSTIISGGTMVLAAAGALPAGSIVTNNSNLNVNASNTITQITGTGALNIGAAGAFTLGGGAASGQNALSIAAGGTLAMNGAPNTLILNYGSGASPNATIRNYLQNGYNAGHWDAGGISPNPAFGSITSAAAASSNAFSIGYADGSDGAIAGLPGGQEEIKFTYAGDANLDGQVNLSDLTILANHFGSTAAQWDQGEFSYDGTVNLADLSILANHFGEGVGSPLEDVAVHTQFAQDLALLESSDPGFAMEVSRLVPEPSSIALLAMSGLGLLKRRRKV